jgi:hypothetical protein
MHRPWDPQTQLSVSSFTNAFALAKNLKRDIRVAGLVEGAAMPEARQLADG